MLAAFIHGFILAFGLIMPLGVQNVFVFNQGATHSSLKQAAPSILTAFICDSILISLAVLGVSLIVLSLPWLKLILYALGFVFLLYMGWVTWHSKMASADQAAKPFTAKRQIVFAFSVSILNPHAIIDTVAVIGTNSLRYSGQAKWAFTVACLLVSFLWFWSLAIVGHHFRRLDKTGIGLVWVNKFSALIIWLVAIYIGWQLFKLLGY